MKKILVIGSINMDLTAIADRHPKVGETIFGEGFSAQQGGKGANQAVAVAKLGGDVKFFGAVGDDIYGEKLTENLALYGVSFCGEEIKDVPSGVALITVAGGDNSIIVIPGANNMVTPELIEKNEELFKEADYLLMQFEIPAESVITAAKLAKKHGCTVVINPAPYREISPELAEHTDLLVPNEHEAESLTGICPDDEESCKKAIDIIRKKGIKNAVITLGSKGSVYSDNDKPVFTPAKKVKAVDTTAAGDTFIGAMLTQLAKGQPMDKAVKIATAASAITVTRIGASDSIPTAAEVENIL